MSDLGTLLITFQVDLNSLTSGIGQARDLLSGFGDEADASSSSFLGGIGSMASSVLDFGAKLGQTIFGVQQLWHSAEQLGQSLLGPAISAETVTTALTTLDGSAAAAAKEMANLNAFAAKTPFKTLDIDQAAEELQGFGTSAADVVPEIQAIGDALGSVGRDTPAQLDSVVQIFGKMRTEGRVTAATMNELAIHGINGWQALADATGKSIPQLKEMVSKGLLPANQAINDLTKGIEMNPLYAGGMSKAAGTFTGLLSTLQSNWDQVIAAFGTPIIKALEGDLNGLGTTLASPAFQSFAGSVGQGMVTVFQDLGGAVHDAATYFGSFDLSGLSSSFKNLGDSVGKVTGPFEQLASNKDVAGFFTTLKNDLSGGIVTAIHDTSVFVNDLAQDLTTLGSNKDVTSFLGSLKTGFQQVGAIVGGQVGNDFQQFGKSVQQVGQWFQADMLPALKQAEPGFTKLGTVLSTDIAPALATIWADGDKLSKTVMPPLTKAFEDLAPPVTRVGGFLAGQLAQGLKTITPDLQQAGGAVSQFGNDISTRAMPVIDNLNNDLHTFLGWIGPYWPGIWAGISTTFTVAWDIIKGTVQVAWAIVSGTIKIGLDLLSGNWKKAWDDVKSTFSGVWDGIKTIADGVWQGISSGMRAGLNDAITILNNFIGSLDSLGVDVGSVHIHPNIPKIPYLFTGGDVAPGQWAVVGDRGPELINGGTSGAHVLSNSASQALVARSAAAQNSSAGAPPVIHIVNENHIYLDSREITDLIGGQMVSQWLNHGHVKTLRSA